MKYQKGTFVVIPNVHVLEHVGPYTLSVFFWICRHSDQNGRCFPSFNLLAREGNMSRRQIIKSVLDLEKIGLIKKTTGKKHSSNRYQVLLVTGGEYGALGSAHGALGVVNGMHPNYIQSNQGTIVANKIRKNKDMKIRGYDENNPSEDLPAFDVDSGESRGPEAPRGKKEAYKALLRWAEDLRGFPFLPAGIPKQYKAFSMASAAKLSAADLKRRWIEMKDDKFWGSKGFDWFDVVNSFNKKGK